MSYFQINPQTCYCLPLLLFTPALKIETIVGVNQVSTASIQFSKHMCGWRLVWKAYVKSALWWRTEPFQFGLITANGQSRENVALH